ncbi:MAG: DUF2442 domain-containing protein [Deltaproteobacteria bacterium]|nr:DUF2442 domain-containing protein [Deltaproteobacteria bacterium]
MAIKVRSFRLLEEYWIELEFTDGSRGTIDFSRWLVGRGGVFLPFADVDFFRRVRLDEEAGTLCWPGGVDLCPDVLRHRATGAALPGVEPTDASDAA